MPFRAYLRTHEGSVSEKTLTNDPAAAVAAFEALVNRADLDGKPIAAALTGDQKQIAYHRFDRKPGDADYWRGRIDEIEIPGFGKAARGGAREGAGRKPTGRTERLTVTMTPDVRAYLEKIGGGSVSEGIERAVVATRAPRTPG